MNQPPLADEIAKALGLPKYTKKAVLTLEPCKLPTIELTMYCADDLGRVITETIETPEGVVQRLAQVQFMLRLERFPE